MKVLELDNTKDFKGWISREAVLASQKKANEDGSYPAVITTEKAAIVVDWERWEVVREILLMDGVSLPGNKQVPLLDAHSRFSTSTIKGSIRNLRTDGTDLIGDVYFWSGAKEEVSKVSEGHLTDLSAGYRTSEDHTVEIRPGKEELVNGKLFKNDYGDKRTLLVRTQWELKEGSLVPIGADSAAKFKSEIQSRIISQDSELQKKLDDATNQIKSLTDKINSIQIKGGPTMADEKDPKEKTPEQLRQDNCAAIMEIGEKNFDGKFKELAYTTVKEIMSGKDISVQDFYKRMTDEMQKNGGAAQKPASYIGMNENELKSYSPTRALQSILKGETKGLEFEISGDIQKRTGLDLSKGEIFMPADYSNVGLRQFGKFNERISHSYATGSEGGLFATPDFRADLLKDVIVNDTVLGRLGCTVITGLRGQFQMPKIVSGLTNYFVAENNEGTTSYVVVGLETVDPKHITGNTELGRLLFMMTDPALGGFDQILMNHLFQSRDIKLDYEGINGDGLTNNMTGILSQSGPTPFSMASVNFKALVNAKRLVKKANGLKQNMKWGMSTDVECVLEVTPKEVGQPYGYILDNGKVIGFNYESSNQIPDNVNMFGNWPEYFILNWGVEKLSVADQPQHKKDIIEISLHSYVNTFLRSSESFAICDDATIDIFGE